MGIELELINDTLPNHVSTDEVLSSMVFKPMSLTPTHQDCVFLDLSERIRKVGAYYSHSQNLTMVSPDMICSFFYDMIRKNAQDRFGVVIMLDNKQHVPPEKKEEQQGRVSSSQSQGLYPYPTTYTSLHDLPDQLIQPDRLGISNNSLLQDFISYFLQYMIARQPYPETIILDCRSNDPPVHLIANTTQYRYEEEWKNQVGESEMRIFWWLQTLHSSFFSHVISTIQPIINLKDSDVLPLSLNYLAYLEFELLQPDRIPARMLWIRDETNEAYKNNPNPIRGLDLVALYKAIRDGTFQPTRHLSNGIDRIRAFVTACILCGCDYYKKKLLTHFFNHNAILMAVCDAWKSSEPQLSIDFIIRFVYSIYARKCMDSKDWEYTTKPYRYISDRFSYERDGESEENEQRMKLYVYDRAIECLIPKFTKRYILPNSATLTSATTKILFTDRYWKTTFQIRLVPPSSSLSLQEAEPTQPIDDIPPALEPPTQPDIIEIIEEQPKKKKPKISIVDRYKEILPPPIT